MHPAPDHAALQGRRPRHRAWLPVLAACSILLACCAAAMLAGATALAVASLRMSPPYRYAMRAARANPAVLIALGEPIRAGWLPSGDFDVGPGGRGAVALRIPIHGPRGAATVQVRGERLAGEWYYQVLSVQIQASGRRIDLRRSTLPGPQANCRTISATSCNTIQV